MIKEHSLKLFVGLFVAGVILRMVPHFAIFHEIGHALFLILTGGQVYSISWQATSGSSTLIGVYGGYLFEAALWLGCVRFLWHMGHLAWIGLPFGIWHMALVEGSYSYDLWNAAEIVLEDAGFPGGLKWLGIVAWAGMGLIGTIAIWAVVVTRWRNEVGKWRRLIERGTVY